MSAVVSVVAAATLASGTSAHAAPGTPAVPTVPAVGAGSAACRPVTRTSVEAIDARGAVRGGAQPALAGRYTFESDGTRIVSVVPPAGWSPLTATDEELRTYGFQPRPGDPAGLAAWRQWYSGFRRVVSPAFCVSNFSLQPSGWTSTVEAGNWSGVVGQQGGYLSSAAVWEQPAFDSTCPASVSSYGIWPGIGGYHHDYYGIYRLMQAGTLIERGGQNTMFGWVELLSSEHVLPASIVQNLPVAPGDVMGVRVTWHPETAALGFEIYNGTQQVASTGEITSYLGYPASEFVDTSTAEAIAERASYNGTLTQLRRPSSGYTQFHGTWFNGRSIEDDSTVESITMVNGTHTLSTAENPRSTRDGLYWQAVWHACY